MWDLGGWLDSGVRFWLADWFRMWGWGPKESNSRCCRRDCRVSMNALLIVDFGVVKIMVRPNMPWKDDWRASRSGAQAQLQQTLFTFHLTNIATSHHKLSIIPRHCDGLGWVSYVNLPNEIGYLCHLFEASRLRRYHCIIWFMLRTLHAALLRPRFLCNIRAWTENRLIGPLLDWKLAYHASARVLLYAFSSSWYFPTWHMDLFHVVCAFSGIHAKSRGYGWRKEIWCTLRACMASPTSEF